MWHFCHPWVMPHPNQLDLTPVGYFFRIKKLVFGCHVTVSKHFSTKKKLCQDPQTFWLIVQHLSTLTVKNCLILMEILREAEKLTKPYCRNSSKTIISAKNLQRQLEENCLQFSYVTVAKILSISIRCLASGISCLHLRYVLILKFWVLFAQKYDTPFCFIF